jgi:hypothetical protein
MLASLIFVIGAAIQTADTHSMGAFYAGRVIAGVGLGAATVVRILHYKVPEAYFGLNATRVAFHEIRLITYLYLKNRH